MSEKEILEAAMKLPPEERARIAHELLESLDGAFDKDVEKAWLEELKRRSQEIDAGTADLEDWGDVRARMIERRARRAG
jgi:putative addiction module component (TIGR02574 family)